MFSKRLNEDSLFADVKENACIKVDLFILCRVCSMLSATVRCVSADVSLYSY